MSPLNQLSAASRWRWSRALTRSVKVLNGFQPYRETQRSISDWSRATFGIHDARTIAARMGKEYAELMELLVQLKDPALGEVERELLASRAAVECADVYIMLVQVADALGSDLLRTADQKMVVNRSRSWAKTPEGDFQHVEEKVRQRPKLFKEPGSGLFMEPGLYYVLSDSGSFYFANGFTTVDGARTRIEPGTATATPRLDPENGHWHEPWDVANVVPAADLWDFWLANDPENLREMNPQLPADFFPEPDNEPNGGSVAADSEGGEL